ncbi:uncharacterized protein JCM6883_007632 [Sporobolomyces salmoneus]|uniref:uncharacterized protein n=1 Tax=Sporobolomyces salmoneus TaxID=183962 RepID=UPI00317A13AA
MDFSKGAGGPVSSLLKATTSDSVSRDHSEVPHASTSTSTSFRQSSNTTSTAQDEFGSFAANTSSNGFKERPYSSTWDRQRETEEIAGKHKSRDGLDIQALLNGSSSSRTLVEETDADWEQEMFESQRKNHDNDSSLPRDPLLPSSTSFSRSQEHHLSGDLSPTSSELLSSLSSLDLSSLAYLKTLLSLPPEQAVQRYIESTESNYSDDVWGLPKGVREVFEKAKDNGTAEENGKEKAVRRLGMLMKHLQIGGGEQVGTRLEDVKGSGKGKAKEADYATVPPQANKSAERARAEWAKEWEEYPIAASHVRSPPRSHFEKSLPPVSPPPPREEFVARILPYPLPTAANSTTPRSHDDFSTSSHALSPVPSSLSPEAFIVHGYSDSSRQQREGEYPKGVYHEVPRKG